MDVDVVAFDVFGTLTDWRSSIAAELSKAGVRAGVSADWAAIADAWRSRYGPTLSRLVRGDAPYQPLDVLHRSMLDEVAEEHGLSWLDSAQRDDLVRAWHRLAPWPDVVPGLTALRERHILTPLSNGGLGLLTRLAKFAGLPFDCILSAELARSYKPDPAVYRLVPDFFGIPAQRVLMVACHPGDLTAAAGCGLRTAYVRRPLEWGPNTVVPPAPAGADIVADDVVDLANRLR